MSIPGERSAELQPAPEHRQDGVSAEHVAGRAGRESGVVTSFTEETPTAVPAKVKTRAERQELGGQASTTNDPNMA